MRAGRRSARLPEPRPLPRDLRIDALRGLALAMIFVNHVPGTVWEGLTSRNFGFSDAAEGFVLLAGDSAGLAYGPAFAPGGARAARLRPMARAITIWAAHPAVTAGEILVAALALRLFGTATLASSHNLAPVFADPLGHLPGLVALGHQLGCANVLPMYVVLLAAAAPILWLATRAPWPLLAGSVALWAVAGLPGANLPNFPGAGGWYFNPLSWQVLFVAGVLTAAWAFLALSALWVRLPPVAEAGGHALWILHERLGLPPLLTAFGKTTLAPPRLLHILALAYVISALPAVALLAAGPLARPLVTLGRQSLPVFATGTVLAYAGQAAKEALPPSPVLDAALVLAGLVALHALARHLARTGAAGGAAALARAG